MPNSFLAETFRLPDYVLSLDEDYAGGQTSNCAYEDWDELSEDAEYQGKSVTLNKPFRSNDGKHKFYVYVKNDKNNVIKLGFGDPNAEIKRDDPARRKAYRDRHDCANPGPKWKAEYWSCRMWADKPVSKITESVTYAQVTFSADGKTQKAYLRVTKDSDKSLSGYEVNKDGDEIAPKGHDRRLRVIDKRAVTKVVPMRMDRTYATLVKEELSAQRG